jgi:hypothetical protein
MRALRWQKRGTWSRRTYRRAARSAKWTGNSSDHFAREIGARQPSQQQAQGREKKPFPGPFPMAGAGFEPATFGL